MQARKKLSNVYGEEAELQSNYSGVKIGLLNFNSFLELFFIEEDKNFFESRNHKIAKRKVAKDDRTKYIV